MPDLLVHGAGKQGEKVEHEDRPKDGHVKVRHKGAHKGHEEGLRAPQPKLELGKAADEGAEFVIGALRQRRLFKILLQIIVMH